MRKSNRIRTRRAAAVASAAALVAGGVMWATAVPASAAETYVHCGALGGWYPAIKKVNLDINAFAKVYPDLRCYQVRARAYYYYGGGVYGYAYGNYSYSVSTVQNTSANYLVFGQGTGKPSSAYGWSGYSSSTKWTGPVWSVNFYVRIA